MVYNSPPKNTQPLVTAFVWLVGLIVIGAIGWFAVQLLWAVIDAIAAALD